MRTLLPVFFACLLIHPLATHAEPVVYQSALPFIPVTLDAAPGETYHLGYLLDAQARIAGIFYEDKFATEVADQWKTFGLASAQKGVVLEQKSSGGKTYELIRLQVALQTDNTVRLTLNYLKNGFLNTRDEVQVGIRFVAKTSGFEAFQLKTGKAITAAKILVKTMGGQQVGIDSIQFQTVSRKRSLRN